MKMLQPALRRRRDRPVTDLQHSSGADMIYSAMSCLHRHPSGRMSVLGWSLLGSECLAWAQIGGFRTVGIRSDAQEKQPLSSFSFRSSSP